MKFPINENLDILLTTILEYSNETLIPIIIKRKEVVKCIRSKNIEFNAVVETLDCKKFTIIINDGILGTFMNVINNLNDEIIDEEIENISEVLLGDKKKKADIYRGIAYSATFFIILHELAHIFRGHFAFMIKEEIFGFSNSRFSFNEMTYEEPKLEEIFKENFIKLAELDADASSLNIILQISLELFATTSDEFDKFNPNWSSEENPIWRREASKIMFYGASLALSLIDAKRGKNEIYPMPFTRIINLLDVFKQDRYKVNGILEYENNPDIQYLSKSYNLDKVDEAVAYIFLNAIDIMLECCKLEGMDISLNFGSEEIKIYRNLLNDFGKLSVHLTPEDLITKEAIEYKQLRLLRPKFNSVFTPFIKQKF